MVWQPDVSAVGAGGLPRQALRRTKSALPPHWTPPLCPDRYNLRVPHFKPYLVIIAMLELYLTITVMSVSLVAQHELVITAAGGSQLNLLMTDSRCFLLAPWPLAGGALA